MHLRSHMHYGLWFQMPHVPNMVTGSSHDTLNSGQEIDVKVPREKSTTPKSSVLSEPNPKPAPQPGTEHLALAQF